MVWFLVAALAAGITGDLGIALCALFLLLGLLRRRVRSRTEGACLAASGVVFFLYGWFWTAGFRTDVDRVLAAGSSWSEQSRLDGWVSRFPYYRYGGAAFDFRTRVEGVECTVLVQTKEFVVDYGDSLRLRGAWKKPAAGPRDAYTRRLLGKGVCGEFRAAPGGVERLNGAGGDWIGRRVLFPCHNRVRTELGRSLGSRAGIPIALLLGETGYLDNRANDAFRALGVTHLLALSGWNLSLVAGALLALLRLLRKRSSGAVLAALVFYVAVVGFIVSLYRALVMAMVLIVASIFKRPLDPVEALAHAFVILVLVYPNTFFSVGFQLSFMATLAVMLCVRILRPPASKTFVSRLVFSIRSSLVVSVAAQLFVTPIILHYFGRMSVMSPVATLVFVLPIAFVLIYSAISVLVSILVPAAGEVVFAGLDRITTLFQTSLVVSSEKVPGTLSFVAPDVWVYYGGLALFVLARGRRWAKIGGILLLVLSFVTGAFRNRLF